MRRDALAAVAEMIGIVERAGSTRTDTVATVGVAQVLPAGVYVAMTGQVFPWDNVQKNKSAGVFQTL